MTRLPIRARLTAAFALALVLVLAAAGLFVYLRLKDDLDESLDSALEARVDAVVSSGQVSAGAAEDAEEGFAQLLTRTGRVQDSVGDVRGPAIDPASAARAGAGGRFFLERDVPDIEGTSRVLAAPADPEPAGPGGDVAGGPGTVTDGAVVVVGESLDDRDETLGGLVTSFALGGPLAVVLASVLGYVLASAGLRPVEAMRRRAGEVSLEHADERLPLPAAKDEVRRLGETLNEMLERLRGSFERERRFVADAGHELRTPVAVIRAELEAALRAGGHDPQLREALVAALEECDHLAQLSEDLLVVARASEGELPLRHEPIDVGPLLESVRARFADRAHERRREIRVHADGGLRVEADDLRLRQALGNLVDNALRHGAGEIELRSRRAEADGAVELEVADQGAGFGDELAEHAFERFSRGDAARSRGGAGLGLAIVRAIAEAHGGRVEIVEGAPGATVRLWLPSAQSQPRRVPSNP